MPVTLGLNHINLNVADVARAERFYLEAFGLVRRFGEGDMLFLGTPGGHDIITLVKAEAGSPIGDGGVSHFGFRAATHEFDAMVAQIERAGAKLLRRGSHGPSEPFAYFTDPDGYTIELGL
ncbi:MAG: VOC family protein [Alphaproteobacteria bacterium]|nr:VOC family protein [Alphaproteobacteria bacterium]